MMTEKETKPISSLDLCEKLVVDFSKVVPEDKGMPNVYINILKTYKGDEQRYRIMLEAFKMLNMYAYKREPAMPQFVHEKWYSVRADVDALPPDKKSEYWKKLNMNDEASKYFKETSENQADNLSNVLFLEDMIESMKKAKDDVHLTPVLAVYNKYPNVMGTWKKRLYE